jgi:hypothetical protein
MTVALAHEILHGHSQLLSQILKRAHLPVARLTNGHAERVGRPVGFGVRHGRSISASGGVGQSFNVLSGALL